MIFSPKAAGGAVGYLSVPCIKSHLVFTQQIFIEHGSVPGAVLGADGIAMNKTEIFVLEPPSSKGGIQ